MYLAARGGKIEEIKKLMETVDLNSIDFNTGNTALHAACEYRFVLYSICTKICTSLVEIIMFLVDAGCDVNVKNRRGQTPLHISVERRLDKMTEYLIEKGGANLYEPDNTGKTPFDLAGHTPQYQSELKEWFIRRTQTPTYQVRPVPTMYTLEIVLEILL
jgi:hypothetical protein